MVVKVKGLSPLPSRVKRDVPVIELVRKFMGDEADYMNDIPAATRLADRVKTDYGVEWEVVQVKGNWHAQIQNTINDGATNAAAKGKAGALTCCVGMWLVFNGVA